MKCIQCQTDNTLKDRTDNQGRCKNCNHPFVFEPTSMTGTVKFTDPFFAKTIADISANHTLFFTPKQFQYFLDRRLRKKSYLPGCGWIFLLIFFNFLGFVFLGVPLNQAFKSSLGFFLVAGLVNTLLILAVFDKTRSEKVDAKSRQESANILPKIGIIILLIGISLSAVLYSISGFIISTILGILAIYLGKLAKSNVNQITQQFLIDNYQISHWLQRWQEVNGSIFKMLPPAKEDNDNKPAAVNPDVTAYSFDRLVVCDRAEIAQLLIANNFHFENNCAILSITGYPQSIFATTMEMLRRNPELKVYALHDCNPRGVGLAHRLRTSVTWFQNSSAIIIDVGLLPRQIIATKNNMFIQSSQESAQDAKQLPADIKQELTTEELAWLESGKFVELESFTPQKLIQVLNRGIAGSRDLDTEEDTGIYIYSSQSFG